MPGPAKIRFDTRARAPYICPHAHDLQPTPQLPYVAPRWGAARLTVDCVCSCQRATGNPRGFLFWLRLARPSVHRYTPTPGVRHGIC
ncbi:protein of unknown function [Cupriavidus taiwanensis]|uniref:Uncharacterized protein n=1 Tax=Cupriavidus taiwanensis TaxID=164546 RepID=A0A375H1Y5_9BURK|nr:hypothetical protein CBM2592_A220031 [Cupriavidus taiwanensis]SOY50950.1 hypothetical protein CBM2587_A200068 [Cupriavidus taiwanensis]SOY83453.1 hypothetical protein CBM2591_A260031 [Cupriavidus taiwanensis]SOZ57545.1 hypothetical protein CBM2617_A240031 [Cupriavidus taiwanensis]SOZ79459.1 hypothetical protein CBM2618_A220031 [Cupriavidus taiwanensis]